MSLTFFNIKSGERRNCETEPMIAAHFNTSDRNPNAHQGQDLGWRIAPETIVELERILKDPTQMQAIANARKVLLENVTETDVLLHISNINDKKNTGVEKSDKDFGEIYEADVRKLKDEQKKRDELIAKEKENGGQSVESPDTPADEDTAKAKIPASPTQTPPANGNISPEQSSTSKPNKK